MVARDEFGAQRLVPIREPSEARSDPQAPAPPEYGSPILVPSHRPDARLGRPLAPRPVRWTLRFASRFESSRYFRVRPGSRHQPASVGSGPVRSARIR